MRILMVAAENGALPGGKVGGVGDVIRDVPRALARRGHEVTVLTPGYGFLSRLPGARPLGSVTVDFAAARQELQLCTVETGDSGGVQQLLLEHPLFCPDGKPRIYHHDAFEPFATDARSFALFCIGVCEALVSGAIPMPDVLHLHDWHAALVLPLRATLRRYQSLRTLRSVFSIHNLSLQGIRPLRGNWSSPEAWFGNLRLPLQDIRDPRYPDCINLMRCGIRLADRVHVVSPGYAREILLPSDPDAGLVRGEGLEADLLEAQRQGRLSGILNGCDYDQPALRSPSPRGFLARARDALDGWAAGRQQVSASWYHALRRIQLWQEGAQRPAVVVGLVGRLTAQKYALLQLRMADGRSALEHLLDHCADGWMVLLGSGDATYENFFHDVMVARSNFLFLNGYAEAFSDLVYHFSDLFLMPSSFEPCGISQLLALRAGTPCLVHAVGGLADTVQHLETGFLFSGEGQEQQAAAMLDMFVLALRMHRDEPARWASLRRKARKARFTWEQAAADYEHLLY